MGTGIERWFRTYRDFLETEDRAFISALLDRVRNGRRPTLRQREQMEALQRIVRKRRREHLLKP